MQLSRRQQETGAGYFSKVLQVFLKMNDQAARAYAGFRYPIKMAALLGV
jgi:hypothetical protein